MNQATLLALAVFPDQFEQFYAAVPVRRANWTPPSWDGIPSEMLTAIGQVCHVRDIEIDGYHVRLRRMLEEDHPLLVSVDGDALAIARRYDAAYASDVLAAIRDARRETLDLVARLTPDQFARTGEFEGYGALTVRGGATMRPRWPFPMGVSSSRRIIDLSLSSGDDRR